MTERQLSTFKKKPGLISFPDTFFTRVMPEIQDLAELKVVLYVAYLILRTQDQPFALCHSERSEESSPTQDKPCEESHAAQGRPKFVTYQELKAESHRLSTDLSEEKLRRALNSAVEHGALLRSNVNIDGVPEDVYSLPIPIYRDHEPNINIFALYEQNIGMITPMIAEELKEAERLYPPRWIEDAFKEAVALNKRSWRYIARILERWGSEGKDSGEYKRNIKKDDPDKYIKGKYGHLVQR
ncbi:MAG TPA: DnaD domain protein [Chloroflexi bacterium]|nr:DnaD domain protein [Chloroflexota bacterium]